MAKGHFRGTPPDTRKTWGRSEVSNCWAGDGREGQVRVPAGPATTRSRVCDFHTVCQEEWRDSSRRTKEQNVKADPCPSSESSSASAFVSVILVHSFTHSFIHFD